MANRCPVEDYRRLSRLRKVNSRIARGTCLVLAAFRGVSHGRGTVPRHLPGDAFYASSSRPASTNGVPGKFIPSSVADENWLYVIGLAASGADSRTMVLTKAAWSAR
jgi:hypothetical protein